MNGQRRARPGKILQCLARRHCCRFHRHAGQNQRLGDLGDGQFLPQSGGGGYIGGHAGDDLIGNPIRLKPPDLFGNRAIQRRIAGMHPGHILPLGMGRDDFRVRLVQRHRRGIHDPGTSRGPCHNRLGHQRPRVQTHRTGRNQTRGFEGQQLRIARPGTNEIDGQTLFPSFFWPKISRGGAAGAAPPLSSPARSPSIFRA